MPTDDLTAVTTLFELSRLSVPPDELTAFARSYPTLRAQADALYRDDLRFEAPMLAFDPTAEYP